MNISKKVAVLASTVVFGLGAAAPSALRSAGEALSPKTLVTCVDGLKGGATDSFTILNKDLKTFPYDAFKTVVDEPELTKAADLCAERTYKKSLATWVDPNKTGVVDKAKKTTEASGIGVVRTKDGEPGVVDYKIVRGLDGNITVGTKPIMASKTMGVKALDGTQVLYNISIKEDPTMGTVVGVVRTPSGDENPTKAVFGEWKHLS